MVSEENGNKVKTRQAPAVNLNKDDKSKSQGLIERRKHCTV